MFLGLLGCGGLGGFFPVFCMASFGDPLKKNYHLCTRFVNPKSIITKCSTPPIEDHLMNAFYRKKAFESERACIRNKTMSVGFSIKLL